MKKKASFLLVALSMTLGSLLAIDVPYGISKEKSNSPQRVPDPGY
ncbi:hypothetical protein [Brevibacillus sp. M2.1A]|nr:hypothetical protein [Brevibacillus sp. M2.1A]